MAEHGLSDLGERRPIGLIHLALTIDPFASVMNIR